MPFNRQEMIHWSEGSGKNLAKNKNKVGSYDSLARKLKTPYVTPETRKAFDLLNTDEQSDLKKIAGWISGAQFSGQWRNLQNLQDRDLATIDIDYSKPGLPVQIMAGLLRISRWAFIAQRAENPLEKAGMVGDFNRAYSNIETAMEKFLPGVYIPGDQHSGNPRYTYAGSTSSNGAVIR